MKTLRFPAIVLAVLVIGFVALLFGSASYMPERVASHFDAAGNPNVWTSRSSLLMSMGFFGLVFPLFFVVLLFGRGDITTRNESRVDDEIPELCFFNVHNYKFLFFQNVLGFCEM